MDNINQVYSSKGISRRTAIKRLLFLAAELKTYFYSEQMHDTECVIRENRFFFFFLIILFIHKWQFVIQLLYNCICLYFIRLTDSILDETSIELLILLNALKSPEYTHLDDELKHLLQNLEINEGINMCENEKRAEKQEARKIAYKVAYVVYIINNY